MDSGGSLLEVPFICYHCGGRSDDLSTLKSHIKFMHKEKMCVENKGKKKAYCDDIPNHMLSINEIVEVQIKEEPDYLLPLDLSKKVTEHQDNHIWIKEEPLDYDTHPLEEVCYDPLSPQEKYPKLFPSIRVASEKLLQTQMPTLPIHTKAIGFQTPTFMTMPQLPEVRFPCSEPRMPSNLSPSLLAMIRAPLLRRLLPAPNPRTPYDFSTTPLLLAVPYICYHCGGRCPDLDSLKTHIDSMHDPVLLLKQKEDADANKKLLQELIKTKVLRLKTRKEKKVKIKIKKEPKSIKTGREKKVKAEKTLMDCIPVSRKRREQKRKIKSEENRPFLCPFCEFRATSFRGLVLHAKVKHKKEREEKMKEAESKGPTYTKTGKKVPPKPFHCLFCDYRSIQKQQLKKHMYAIHAKQKKLQCPFCLHRSAYSENMKWHIITKHKYKCPHCDFRSTTKANLVSHQESNCKELYAAEEANECSAIVIKNEFSSVNVKNEQDEVAEETVSDKNISFEGEKDLLNVRTNSVKNASLVNGECSTIGTEHFNSHRGVPIDTVVIKSESPDLLIKSENPTSPYTNETTCHPVEVL